FTPKRTVNQMLDLPNIREACQNLTSTFLEPAAGEGTFLVEILKRKMQLVTNDFGNDLTRYENFSLLALSTLYGVELLEDNAQKCVMNMYQKNQVYACAPSNIIYNIAKNYIFSDFKNISTKNIVECDLIKDAKNNSARKKL